jgi:hypothetical protein
MMGLATDILGVLGIALAIFQIHRTGTVVRATHDSIEHTSKQLGVYSVLLVLAELDLVEHQFSSAIAKNDPQETKRLLREWRRSAGQLKGLLSADLTGDIDTTEFAKLVQDSLTLATKAKIRIERGNSLTSATSSVLNSCDEVCTSAKTITALIRSTPPPSLTRRSGLQEFLATYGFQKQEGVRT